MKVLNNQEIQFAAGGCPTCLVVPGTCLVAAGVAAMGTGWAGWAGYKTIAYAGAAASVAMMGISAYYLYDRFAPKADAQVVNTQEAS